MAGSRQPGVPAPHPLAGPRGDHALPRACPGALDRPRGDGQPNIIEDDIIRRDPDGFVATTRGRRGGAWAHWQLALSYARYLSPAFHLWCNAVVRAALAWHDTPPAADIDPLQRHLARQFRDLHARLNTLERHAADLMFLQLSAQELMLGNRLEFTTLTRTIMI
ncbi:MAG: KilA-N domain-containing protein, partial [Acetobacteraceae bacterium]